MKKVITGLMLALFLLDVAYAANSYSIAVSCSIPAVPGLNVPLAEETEEKSTPVAYDNEGETLLAEKIDTATLIKTVYTR